MLTVETEHLLSFLGVVIAAYLSYLAARATSAGKRGGTEQRQDDDKLQALADRLVDVMDQGFTARDRIIGTLDGRVQRLERKDDAWRRHVLDWRATHPDRERWPVVPQEVRPDLPD